MLILHQQNVLHLFETIMCILVLSQISTPTILAFDLLLDAGLQVFASQTPLTRLATFAGNEHLITVLFIVVVLMPPLDWRPAKLAGDNDLRTILLMHRMILPLIYGTARLLALDQAFGA